MKPKGKITRDESEKRLAFVENGLIALTPLRRLYREFCAEFGTSRRTAERWVRRVHEAWAAESKAEREAKRREIERSVDWAFQVAAGGNNPRAMVAALDLKARLHGLLQAERGLGDGDPSARLILPAILVEQYDRTPGSDPVQPQPETG